MRNSTVSSDSHIYRPKKKKKKKENKNTVGSYHTDQSQGSISLGKVKTLLTDLTELK